MIKRSREGNAEPSGSKRGQVEGSDLFVAATMFIILFTGVILVFNSYSDRFDSSREFRRMQTSALQTADLMVKTGGLPSGWHSNPNSTRMIGLAHSIKEQRNISPEKLDSLLALNYTRIKEITGAPYEIRLEIRGIGGDVIAEKGKEPGGETVVRAERRVFYEGEDAIFSLTMWR